MKKLLLLLLSVVFVLSSFVGCKDKGDGEQDGKVTLNVYASMDYKNVLKASPNDKMALLMKYVEETFEAENQDININFQNKGWGESLNATLVRDLNLSGKNAPDIVFGEEYVRNFIEDNKFMALELSDEVKNDLIPAVKDYITKDGKIYAAPLYTGTYALSINKAALRNAQVIDAAGNITDAFKTAIAATVVNADYQQVDDINDVNPLAPETWEDLLLVCQYIKNYYTTKGDNRNGGMTMSNIKGDSQWKALAFMRSAGGDFADENGAPALNTPENIKAFEMMRAFSRTAGSNGIAGTVDGTQLMYANFFNGRAAYMVEGAELLARSYQYSSFNDADLTTAILPCYEDNIGEKRGNALVGTVYYSINAKKSENYKHSMKFINFLLSETTLRKYYEMDRRIPVRSSILNDSNLLTNEPRMEAFITPLTSNEKEKCPEIYFLPSTASGPVQEASLDNRELNHDIHGPWLYMGEKTYEHYNRIECLFAGEFGCNGMASFEQVEKITGNSVVTDMSRDVIWRHHGDWWDVSTFVEELFGKVTDLRQYSLISQYFQAVGLFYGITTFRRQAFRQSGCMVWQLNEMFPMISCTTLIEYYGSKKPAYYAAKKAYAQKVVSFKFNKLAYSEQESLPVSIYLTNEKVEENERVVVSVYFDEELSQSEEFFVKVGNGNTVSVCQMDLVVKARKYVKVVAETKNAQSQIVFLVKDGNGYCDPSVLEKACLHKDFI